MADFTFQHCMFSKKQPSCPGRDWPSIPNLNFKNKNVLKKCLHPASRTSEPRISASESPHQILTCFQPRLRRCNVSQSAELQVDSAMDAVRTTTVPLSPGAQALVARRAHSSRAPSTSRPRFKKRLFADPGTPGTLRVWCRLCVSAE